MSTSRPGVDTHEMVLIHRVIRREFGQLPRLFRSAANDRARSKVIGAHAREMLDFLHTHHTGEDELLFPLLRERAALDPGLMDRMDAQHAQVNDAVAAVGAELPAWTASADAAAGERMAACIGGGAPAQMVTSDTVPLGEVDVRRGDPVHATDGDIGRVQGLVIDPRSRHVTHVLLQEGHLWGRKEVAIPISAVASTIGGIRLKIAKQQVQDLPPVNIDHLDRSTGGTDS